MNTTELQLAILKAKQKVFNQALELEDAQDYFHQKRRELEAAEDDLNELEDME